MLSCTNQAANSVMFADKLRLHVRSGDALAASLQALSFPSAVDPFVPKSLFSQFGMARVTGGNRGLRFPRTCGPDGAASAWASAWWDGSRRGREREPSRFESLPGPCLCWSPNSKFIEAPARCTGKSFWIPILVLRAVHSPQTRSTPCHFDCFFNLEMVRGPGLSSETPNPNQQFSPWG